MATAGSSLMGIGTVTGKSRAREAALSAIQPPLLDEGIERATGIVWNITGGSDMTLFEVIYDLVDPNVNLIFGAVVDEALHGSGEGRFDSEGAQLSPKLVEKARAAIAKPQAMANSFTRRTESQEDE